MTRWWQRLVQRPWLALVAALVVETLVFLLGPVDFVVSDPLWYANLAHRLSIDPAEVFATHDTFPFVMRIGLTVPMAVLYRVFSPSPLVTNLPCLLAALGVVLVVWAAAPTPRAKWLAMLLSVSCVPLMRHTAVLNVDLPCAALMACSILWLSWRDRPRGTWWLVGAVIAWVMAFLVKEAALWCGVVWIYALVVDVRRDGLLSVARRFALALAVGAALAAGYLALCARLWGDPLARFHGIEDMTYKHAWTLHGQPPAVWLRRLSWEPAVLIGKMFRATLVPALAAAWWVRGRERIWWFSTAAFVLLYWFGSTSFSSYSPLPISQRMVLEALPGILVLATLGSDHALTWAAGVRWRMAVAAVVALAVIVPAGIAIAAELRRATPETASYALVRDEVADPARRVVVVCGEPRCVDASVIYFRYAVPANLTVMFASDFARQPLPAGATVRALVDLDRAEGARRTDPKLDRTAPIVALGMPPLLWHRSVRLYDAGNGERLWNALRAAP
jgi:hypothetical protein